jgi:carbon storage regulator
MLVLSRKLNESIRIGDDIEITILEVRGKRIRVGLVAPADVAIRRVETSLEESSSRTARSPQRKRTGGGAGMMLDLAGAAASDRG